MINSDQTISSVEGIRVSEELSPEFAEILTPEALQFLAELHRQFNPEREEILVKRIRCRYALHHGQLLRFLDETADIRNGDWKVAPVPDDLQDWRVEITGPVEKKMMINALNSGANVFMADFEDALSPTWSNVILGQINLKDAVRRQLTYESPEGKQYRLQEKLATLVVRPRGWHLQEKHVLIDGKPMSASLFDFGLYLFHNATELIARGTGPYFYLPKLESHIEARLWDEVFEFAEGRLDLPSSSIRATVLIETISAAFEMDEILYELREHAVGLNAGRWDYMFSIIKNFCFNPSFILPDRAQVTMTVPFMQAYCELLVETCHRRDAHAMGGMAAFVPSRKDAEINEAAFKAVRADKEREVHAGFDGTWVAHPDLVAVAREPFDTVLGQQPHQKSKRRSGWTANLQQMLTTHVPDGKITETGVRNNINVALQYIESWLRGTGAAAIHNLMEDAATAEIARAQLWQWIHNRSAMTDGRLVTHGLYKKIRDEEFAALTKKGPGMYPRAARILDELTDNEHFVEFLTVPAYNFLD